MTRHHLPPGGEAGEQFTVLEADPGQRSGGMVVHWTLEQAEQWKAWRDADTGGLDEPYHPGPLAVFRREMWTWDDGPVREAYGPWTEVAR